MENQAFWGGAALVVVLAFIAYKAYAAKKTDRSGTGSGSGGGSKKPQRPKKQA